ncbi:hypothetical protein KC19_12G134300 [Ceratodon purpureus]|uniref:(S)-ureidoglycine aminohydrolase cupin domain-containing protein n=1 Tax=Ceratodon purpureus TaxID=3225 RepID=A0A8T0G815_CERPU|nr:hypothetical protein KC19_12G134300 [Ceratodon purpureus]
MAMALSATALTPGLSARQPTLPTPKTSLKTSHCSLSATTAHLFAGKRGAGARRRGGAVVTCYARPLRPVEERFRIQVERNVDEARLKELAVQRWSKWESDVSAFDHEWKVDEQVYVVRGSVKVTPEDCQDSAYFYAGDLVRFPKWFCATLSFDGEYEQRYRFLAYGDD